MSADKLRYESSSITHSSCFATEMEQVVPFELLQQKGLPVCVLSCQESAVTKQLSRGGTKPASRREIDWYCLSSLTFLSTQRVFNISLLSNTAKVQGEMFHSHKRWQSEHVRKIFLTRNEYRDEKVMLQSKRTISTYETWK